MGPLVISIHCCVLRIHRSLGCLSSCCLGALNLQGQILVDSFKTIYDALGRRLEPSYELISLSVEDHRLEQRRFQGDILTVCPNLVCP